MEANNMFNKYEELNCKLCGKDVLKDVNNSIAVINEDGSKISTVYVCCKGECDNALGSPNGWKELSEFTNPYLHLKHIMAVLNNMNAGLVFEPDALEAYKEIILKTAPFVFRDMDEGEIQSASFSNMMPF